MTGPEAIFPPPDDRLGMSLARAFGRVGALAVALSGLAVTYYGLYVVGPGLGSETAIRTLFTPSPTNTSLAIGSIGLVAALAALPVLVGRGRWAAISVGTFLVVLSTLAIVSGVITVTAWLSGGLIGLLLFFAGASLNGHHGDPA
ncbi:hypothetical protein C499_11646 [Halogeometricum borinquense DSM 11551]|uniref:Uncharacterized protein n=3 Tax=Halogeometricum borinquense TaxID=60847 RepID=E4NSW8_HALBP|nr:hypothetical protein Hbor_02460 [Halogeometricum borinquense DSM 11551]ELY26858.1 hypothetical protein C499_11646 [Halogeometricum borinquense DSM 11551]RYJ14876.1 hypothetical protein ELS19_13540 [Halogeometricum borinquense]